MPDHLWELTIGIAVISNVRYFETRMKFGRAFLYYEIDNPTRDLNLMDHFEIEIRPTIPVLVVLKAQSASPDVA
jgi:hypothetical protein